MNEVFLLIFNNSREAISLQSPDTLVKIRSCDEQTAFVRSELVNLGLMTCRSAHAHTAFFCFHSQECVGGFSTVGNCFFICLYTFKSLFCSTPCSFISLIVKLLSYLPFCVGFGCLRPHTFWFLLSAFLSLFHLSVTPVIILSLFFLCGSFCEPSFKFSNRRQK